jgi:hypothetical protein
MKRKNVLPLTGLPVPESIKTSISMPSVLVEFGEREVHGFGFSSFSSYLAELVRRRRELDLLNTRANYSPEEEAAKLAGMASGLVKPEPSTGETKGPKRRRRPGTS